MNLREKFIWNLLIGISAIAILYYIYIDYNNYESYNNLWNEYSHEELGTDKILEDKIKKLETKIKKKEEYVFKFKNNPTDLRRIIEIEGMEGYFGLPRDYEFTKCKDDSPRSKFFRIDKRLQIGNFY